MTRTLSTEAFLDLLRNSKLLTDQRLGEYLVRARPLPEDPKGAARHLVKAGLLTAFQAGQLLAGRYKGFFLLGGQYKVLRPIGRGGMGSVFLCEHMQLHRQVAIKVLPREQASDPATLERFQREARAAAALDHANIVRVYDVSASPDLALLVMEYAEGKNLQQVLDDDGPVPCRKAVGYAIQAAAGLQHAFERGVVHRDIKPANLLLCRNGTVKILDMGLARFQDKEDRLTQKHDGACVLGTADYMSPEQALSGRQVDIRADIYSLGATLYTLLTGRPPFGGTASQKLVAHQVLAAVPAHEVRPEVPEALSVIIARMMAKEPADRFATPAEVITALTPFASATAPAPQGPRRTHPRAHELGSPRQLLVGAGVGALAAVTLVVGLLIARQSPSAVASPVSVQPPPSDPPPRQPDIPAPPASRPANPPAPPQPAEKVLYRLNLDGQEPFVQRIEHKAFFGSPPLPESWQGFCWKDESVAEILADRVSDSMALAFRNLSGEPTCQLTTTLGGILGNLEPGRRYFLRVEYQGQREANGQFFVRRGDSSSITSGRLRPTEGRWETVELPIEQEASLVRDIAFCTAANGPQTTVFIRSVVLVER
jgi:serine/threonine protein kinase